MLKVYGVSMYIPYYGSYETMGYYATEEEAEEREDQLREIRDETVIFSVTAEDSEQLRVLLNTALLQNPPGTYL